MDDEQLDWLLASDEPWTRYRTRIDLLKQSEQYPKVKNDRYEMLDHPDIQALIADVNSWPGYALKRHNDAKHTIHKFSTLADFGLTIRDPGMLDVIQLILNHQAKEGAFQTLENFPKAFGGSGEDLLGWVMCDAPTLLYTLFKG